MIWFTADLHFDHPWMAKQRGFTHTSRHDAHLIATWNKHVKRGDHVVVCGDVFWSDHPHIVAIWKMLHGAKTLVKGNHDHWLKKNKDVKYHKIYEHNYKINENSSKTQKVVACHYPLRSWNQKIHGAIHVHGHCHGKIVPHWHMMDVGVDVAKIMFGSYRPINLEELRFLLREVKHADKGRFRREESDDVL
jgi:calcineurin-like phosphoesterase family protein